MGRRAVHGVVSPAGRKPPGDAIAEASAGLPPLAGAFLGLAGSASGGVGARVEARLRGRFPDLPLEIGPDIRCVIEAAEADGGCVAAILGTGGCVYADDGAGAMFRAAEGVEDDAAAGRRDLLALDPGPRDFVLGVSASGGAAYVAAALAAARERGAKTASLSSNPATAIAREADVEIVVDTCAEVVTGSTRLKAGNAQKMVLNMVSTCAMAKTGKVLGNLMVNLRPSNKKLRNHMVGIVETLAGVDAARAEAMLEASGWSIPAASARRNGSA